MSKRVAIEIGAPHEEYDERLTPDGQLRRLVNARHRRNGGLESSPGWLAWGPFAQGESYDTGWSSSIIAPVEHGSALAMIGTDALFELVNSATMRGVGDIPSLAAPRRFSCGGRSEIPLGVSSVGAKVYALVQDETDVLHYVTFSRDGANLVMESRKAVDIYRSYTVLRGQACIQPGTATVFAATTDGFIRKSMADDYAPEPMVGTPTSCYGIMAFTDTLGNPLVVASGTLGTLSAYSRSGAAWTTTALSTVLEPTALLAGWHACVGNTSDGVAALFVAFRLDTPSEQWRISAFRLSLLPVAGAGSAYIATTTAGAYSETCDRMTIGPRLDVGNGVYVFQTGIPKAATITAHDAQVTAWTVSSVGLQDFEFACRRWFPEDYKVRLDTLEPIAGWADSGSESYLAVSSWALPLHERGYVLSARMASNGGRHVSVRIESVFAPGAVYSRSGSGAFPSWVPLEHSWQSAAVDTDGRFIAAVPIATVRDATPDEVAVFTWSTSGSRSSSDPVGVACRAGGLTTIAGGVVSAYSGGATVDLGFGGGAPRLESLAEDGSGSVTANWQYCVVWEWSDAFGARHLSSPSKVYSLAVTSAETVKIGIPRRGFPSGMRNVVAHVYRTESDGVTFYEIELESAAFGGDSYGLGVDPGDDGILVYDNNSDSSIRDNPILYTQGATGALGGQLPYSPPPACRSIASNGTRVLCGGLENLTEVHWSHMFFPGEAPSWSDDGSLKMRFQDEVVAVAWGGASWLVFSPRRVWSVSGEGPDVSGSGEWYTPTDVQCPTGAHSPLSVAQTSIGVVFQGSDSMVYVVAPGASQASLLGPPLWATLKSSAESGDWIVSIVEVDRGGLRSIVLSTGLRRLVYDVAHQAWTVETLTATGRGANINGQLMWAVSRIDGSYIGYDAAPGTRPLWAERQDVLVDFGRIYPFAKDGYGRVRKVIPLLSAGGYTARLAIYDLDKGDSAQFFGTGDSADWDGGDPGRWTRVSWAPAAQKRDSILLRLIAEGVGGWRFNGIALDIDRDKNGARRKILDGVRYVEGGSGATPETPETPEAFHRPWSDEFAMEYGGP